MQDRDIKDTSAKRQDDVFLSRLYPGYRDKETMKVIRHESLGIYVYANPRNKREQSKFFIYRFFAI